MFFIVSLFVLNVFGQIQVIDWAKLLAENGTNLQAAAWFGYSVALSNDGLVALVGAIGAGGSAGAGAAYIFTRPSTMATWTQQQKLTAGGNGTDSEERAYFGLSVAVSGAHRKDEQGKEDAGAAFVFSRPSASSSAVWIQQQKLTAGPADLAADAWFGDSVALSNDGLVALVGARANSENGQRGAGAAYLFSRPSSNSSVWTQHQKLTADLQQEAYFGVSVSLSGDGSVALVGAFGTLHNNGTVPAESVGAAYVFGRNTSSPASEFNWTLLQKLTAAHDAEDRAFFGNSVSLSGDGRVALVGAYNKAEAGNPVAGAVYVFSGAATSTVTSDTSDVNVWTMQQKLTAAGPGTDLQLAGFFGHSVSVSHDGLVALVGASVNREGGQAQAGAAYLFRRTPLAWIQQAKLTATSAGGEGGREEADARFGGSVSLSADGTVALVGAHGKDEQQTVDVGAAYTFNVLVVAGAAAAQNQSTSTATSTTSNSAAALDRDLATEKTAPHHESTSFSLSTTLTSSSSHIDLSAVPVAVSVFPGFTANDVSGPPAVANIAIASSAGALVLCLLIVIVCAAVRRRRRQTQNQSHVHGGAGGARAPLTTLVTSSAATTTTSQNTPAHPSRGSSARSRSQSRSHSQRRIVRRSKSSGSLVLANVHQHASSSTRRHPIYDQFQAPTAPYDQFQAPVLDTNQYHEFQNPEHSLPPIYNDLQLQPVYDDLQLQPVYDDLLLQSNKLFVLSVYGQVNVNDWLKLIADDGMENDYFGWAVSLSNDGLVALVGAPEKDESGFFNAGAAYIFSRPTNSSSWAQQQKFTAGSDVEENSQFGQSVSLSGDGLVALIGAHYKDDEDKYDAGVAYIFSRPSTDSPWTRQQKLTAGDGNDLEFGAQFGYSVSLSGDGLVALVGARYKIEGGKNKAGAAYIFSRPSTSSSTWTQQKKLTAGDGIDVQQDAEFGYSVSLSNDGLVALVGGARAGVGGAPHAGAAFIFTLPGPSGSLLTWTKLVAGNGTDLEEDARFGGSVSLSGDGLVALVGAPFGGQSDAGAAYVFSRPATSSSTWTQQQKLTAAAAAGAAPDSYANFGSSVSLSANGLVALVGAPSHLAFAVRPGATYIFTRPATGSDSSTWTQRRKLTAGNGTLAHAQDQFGCSVAASNSASTALVGAFRELGGSVFMFDLFVRTPSPTSSVPSQPPSKPSPAPTPMPTLESSPVPTPMLTIEPVTPPSLPAGTESTVFPGDRNDDDAWTPVPMATAATTLSVPVIVAIGTGAALLLLVCLSCIAFGMRRRRRRRRQLSVHEHYGSVTQLNALDRHQPHQPNPHPHPHLSRRASRSHASRSASRSHSQHRIVRRSPSQSAAAAGAGNPITYGNGNNNRDPGYANENNNNNNSGGNPPPISGNLPLVSGYPPISGNLPLVSGYPPISGNPIISGNSMYDQFESPDSLDLAAGQTTTPAPNPRPLVYAYAYDRLPTSVGGAPSTSTLPVASAGSGSNQSNHMYATTVSIRTTD